MLMKWPALLHKRLPFGLQQCCWLPHLFLSMVATRFQWPSGGGCPSTPLSMLSVYLQKTTQEERENIAGKKERSKRCYTVLTELSLCPDARCFQTDTGVESSEPGSL